MRVRTTVVFAGLVLFGAVPAGADAQGTGEVGGPPSMGAPLPFPPPQKKTFLPKATSEAIVIGVGSGPLGRVEIVGQGVKGGICIDVDQVTRGSSSGTCGSVVIPRSIAIESENFEMEKKRSRSLSEVAGFTQPSVAGVSAIASRSKGHRRSRKAVSGMVAVPSSDLLARLHQSTPFGYFVADFRGCLTEAKMKAQAFDTAGVVLGSSAMPRPAKLFPNFASCTPGSSSVFVVGTSARTAVAR